MNNWVDAWHRHGPVDMYGPPSQIIYKATRTPSTCTSHLIKAFNALLK